MAIYPTALLPGAAPPAKQEKQPAVGFDQPVEAATLHTAQKVSYVRSCSFVLEFSDPVSTGPLTGAT